MPKACAPHRTALVDLVDRGERGPATPAALDHIAVCDACRTEVTELALTIAALRRAGAAFRSLPEPRVLRPVIPAVRRTRSPWRLRGHLGSLVMGAGIAALLVVPRAGLGPQAGPQAGTPTRPPLSQPTAVSISWRATEARIAANLDTPSYAAVVTLPRRYPDGLPRPRKEVPPTDATPRDLKPS